MSLNEEWKQIRTWESEFQVERRAGSMVLEWEHTRGDRTAAQCGRDWYHEHTWKEVGAWPSSAKPGTPPWATEFYSL